ncbi:hypothetical protein ILUMI_08262 [Ignelater luminosus]|uniref:Peptidase S1 domain-containing protein n=1 Tax=Ignelater luminosus TaxID=2038154 RepID=A0A8K0D6F6_IGNLU|nr:hypothetical protein ILUMI_08262 [Ignelater luminosus]
MTKTESPKRSLCMNFKKLIDILKNKPQHLNKNNLISLLRDVINYFKRHVIVDQPNYQTSDKRALPLLLLQKLIELLEDKFEELSVTELKHLMDIFGDFQKNASAYQLYGSPLKNDTFTILNKKPTTLLSSKSKDKHLTKNDLIILINDVFDHFQRENSSGRPHEKSLLLPLLKKLTSFLQDESQGVTAKDFEDFQKKNSDIEISPDISTTLPYKVYFPTTPLQNYTANPKTKPQHLDDDKLISLLNDLTKDASLYQLGYQPLQADITTTIPHNESIPFLPPQSKSDHLIKNELTSLLKDIFDHFRNGSSSSYKPTSHFLAGTNLEVPFENSLQLLLIQKLIPLLQNKSQDLTLEDLISSLKNVVDDYQKRTSSVSNITLPYKVYFPTLALPNATEFPETRPQNPSKDESPPLLKDQLVQNKLHLQKLLQKLTEILESIREDLNRDNLKSLLKDISAGQSNINSTKPYESFSSLSQKLVEFLKNNFDNLTLDNLMLLLKDLIDFQNDTSHRTSSENTSSELYHKLLSSLYMLFRQNLSSKQLSNQTEDSDNNTIRLVDLIYALGKQSVGSSNQNMFTSLPLQQFNFNRDQSPKNLSDTKIKLQLFMCILTKCNLKNSNKNMKQFNNDDYSIKSEYLIKGVVDYKTENSSKYARYRDKGGLFGSERGISKQKEQEDAIERRIIGGEVALRGEFPYHVAVYTINIFQCGSCLISEYYVLTAAHCIEGFEAEDLWFRAGSNSLLIGGDIYRASDIIIHEQYANGDYDISLIKSERPVRFTVHVQPISLPALSDPETPPGTRVTVSGWGAIENISQKPSYKLHKLELRITTRQRCRERVMASSRMITKRQICTTGPRKESGTCFGDSGGPLVANGKLVGIISWGSPCAIGDPDVYTNVRVFLPWIASQMKNLEISSDATENENFNYRLDHPSRYTNKLFQFIH